MVDRLNGTIREPSAPTRWWDTGSVPLDGGSLHYAYGPTVAVVVVCLLGVLLRWVFGSGRSRGARTAGRAAGSGGYGLLRSVATVAGRPEGNALRALLSDAGIRSTLTARPDGRVDILVFPEDVDRARQLIPPIR
jgi:hypothetical protein